MSAYVNLLGVLTRGRSIADGMEWGIRSVHPDLRSSREFRWPATGWAICSLPDDELTRGDECPSREGDGLCVARTWSGMATAGIPAQTLLLTQHYASEVLGESPDRVRVARANVVDIVDGFRLVREYGRGANLAGANLRRANLTHANLRGASLRGANLYSADLYGADMRHADMRHTDLRGANLNGADMTGANLFGADLFGADLRGASLEGANVSRANLRDTDLYGASGLQSA